MYREHDGTPKKSTARKINKFLRIHIKGETLRAMNTPLSNSIPFKKFGSKTKLPIKCWNVPTSLTYRYSELKPA